jgi:hypothetical protein
MTQATFTEVLRSAVPELTISDGPVPDGYSRIKFHVQPTPQGVRLNITIGEGRPHRFTFSSEEEAAEFIGRLCAVAKT